MHRDILGGIEAHQQAILNFTNRYKSSERILVSFNGGIRW